MCFQCFSVTLTRLNLMNFTAVASQPLPIKFRCWKELSIFCNLSSIYTMWQNAFLSVSFCLLINECACLLLHNCLLNLFALIFPVFLMAGSVSIFSFGCGTNVSVLTIRCWYDVTTETAERCWKAWALPGFQHGLCDTPLRWQGTFCLGYYLRFCYQCVIRKQVS